MPDREDIKEPGARGSLWAEVLLVKRDVEGLRHEFAGVRGDIKDLRDIVQATSKPREPKWSLWLTIIGMLAAGLLFFTNSITVNTTRPLEDKAARVEATLARITPLVDLHSVEVSTIKAQNATSVTDRSDLNRLTQTNEARIAKLEAQYAGEHADRVAHQTEIETQFRLGDQNHNIQWAAILRWVSLLWQKSYGEPFPSDIQYYPGVAQPPPVTSTNHG